jgi:predicted Zn finger-like uncharacterized protein
MPVRTACPHCQTAYNVPDELAGRKVRCKQCQQPFTVGAAPAAAAVEAPPAVEPVPTVVAAEPAEPAEVRPAVSPAPQPAAPAAAPRSGGIRRPAPGAPRGRAAQPQAAGGTGSLLLALVIVGGALVLLGGVGAAVGLLILKDAREPAIVMPTKTVEAPDTSSFWDDDEEGPPGAGRQANQGGEEKFFDPKLPEASPALPVTFQPATPSPQLGTESPAAPTADGSLPPDVLRRVKRSTAHLRVVMSDGTQGQGSGFFTGEPGLLVTNAHVVGMKDGDGQKPRKVEVEINAGEKDERRLAAEVLAVDRKMDLALLRVQGDNLPPPMPLLSASSLHETQRVYVIGFPYGDTLGKDVTVSPTSVSSLRKENGRLVTVQVQGGMNPGNSGGPVVDTQGRVVGVAVSIFVANLINTGINNAVPSDYVHYLLNGQFGGLTVGPPIQSGQDVTLHVHQQVTDPRGGVKKVVLEWWVGDPGPERPAAMTKPEAAPGDSPRRSALLHFGREEGGAAGFLALPPLPQGKTYWLQPVFTDAAGRPRWGSAFAYEARAAVQAKPLPAATPKPAAGGLLDLLRKADFKLRNARGGELSVQYNLGAKLQPPAAAKTAGAETAGAVQFTDFNLGVRINDRPVPRNRQQMIFQQRLRPAPGPASGGPAADLSRLSSAARQKAEPLQADVQQLVRALDLSVKDAELKVGQSWNAVVDFPVDAFLAHESRKLNLVYRYMGTQVRNGTEEAVIRLEGELAGGEGQKPAGRLGGVAYVHPGTRQTTLVQAAVDLDMEVNAEGIPATLTGRCFLNLQRGLQPAAGPTAAAE